MTCRDALAIQHPEQIDPTSMGGCNGCPSHYGYMRDPEHHFNCDKCWDRELPAEQAERIGKAVMTKNEYVDLCRKNGYLGTIPSNLSDGAKTKTMSREEFEALLDELDDNSLTTLKEKNARYCSNDDTLHNFNAGAEIAGVTPAQCAWGYATKHLVALRDKVLNNDFSDREDFLEKCQDSINYIRFIWCLGNAGRKDQFK